MQCLPPIQCPFCGSPVEYVSERRNRDSILVDPLAGSGTTLAVAVGLGRHGIGIELNAAYIELAHERISKVQRPLSFTPEGA